MRTLTPEEAKAFYDHFGAKQDRQAFYEAPALRALVANSSLPEATSVFEYGCGTGQLAATLLREQLSPSASYLGIDISTTMTRLASDRLAGFSPRASIQQVEPSTTALPAGSATADRFLSTYVLDLLPDAAVRRVLAEAARILRPGGLLCLAGVTHGATILSRVVMSGWRLLFNRRPAWVGGCRPTSLSHFVTPDAWATHCHQTVVSWGIASEVLVASPRGTAAAGA